MIKIRNLKKSYGQLNVLKGINLDIAHNEVVSLIGPSGSGKSTLLRILMTLEWPDSGEIEIDGTAIFTMQKNQQTVRANEKHLQEIRKKVSMVFQHFNLFPHMSVLENLIEAPIYVKGMKKPAAIEKAMHVLDKVELANKCHAKPSELSGGQKQRVAIARALCLNPEIMLFDEITSALDPELVGGVLALLKELADSHSTTMLIVTHEMGFAKNCSDRILFFDQGVILEDAKPVDLFERPQHQRTKEFIESVQFSDY